MPRPGARSSPRLKPGDRSVALNGPSGRSERRAENWPPGTFLARLNGSSRAALLELGAFREYPARVPILREGETSAHVLLLHGGWVKIVAGTPEGGRAMLAIRSRGELVGEEGALNDRPRSASVISIGPVTAYVVTRGNFLRCLAGHPDVHLAVTRDLSARLREATRRRVDFTGQPGDVRLARVLCELARMNSRMTAAGVELGYSLTQPELAAMAGVSEPSVQRSLSKLRDSGVLGTGRRRIVIHDLAALSRAAGQDCPAEPAAS
jgi:CRP/FNR family transcriptional regulator, cyclic AMP receptor protein